MRMTSPWIAAAVAGLVAASLTTTAAQAGPYALLLDSPNVTVATDAAKQDEILTSINYVNGVQLQKSNLPKARP